MELHPASSANSLRSPLPPALNQVLGFSSPLEFRAPASLASPHQAPRNFGGEAGEGGGGPQRGKRTKLLQLLGLPKKAASPLSAFPRLFLDGKSLERLSHREKKNIQIKLIRIM